MKRIVIAGGGKMGRWMALALAQENIVCIYDIKAGIIKDVQGVVLYDKLQQIAAFNPEILINAVTPGKTIEAFNEIIPHTSKECVLVDIASVKTGLQNFYESSGNKFVSMHPMFGPTFGDFNSIQGKNLILITESHIDISSYFSSLFDKMGLDIRMMSFNEHDKAMASSLALPVALSFLFLKVAKSSDVQGTTYLRQLEISSAVCKEDLTLLINILSTPDSAAMVEDMRRIIETILDIISSGDIKKLTELIEEVKAKALDY